MKLFQKPFSLLLALVLVLGLFSGTAVFSLAVTAIDYSFGEEWRGRVGYDNNDDNYVDKQLLHLKILNKSHLFVKFECNTSYVGININNSTKTFYDDSISTKKRNSITGKWYYEYSCNLNAGDYNLVLYDEFGGDSHYISSFFAFCEPIVSLSTPAISTISSPSGGSLSVGYGNVKDALSYQIQYSTNTSFSNAKTIETPALNYKIAGLSTGKYYYVRVRAYTVYNDGLRVYSNWSRAQSVYVKKLTNTVSISTSSKKLSYSTLKKKSVSFIVVAQDKANAPFKFSLSAVPEKLKGKISINSSTGAITLKKGAPKGTFSVGVKVVASATSSYNKASTKKILKITIS